MGFGIGRVFRRAFGFAKGIVGGVLKATGIGKLLKPLMKLIGPLAKFLKPMLGFLSKLGPLAFMFGGPIGMIAGILSKVGTVSQLAGVAKNLIGGAGGHGAIDPTGILNMARVTAHRHSQLI